MTSYMSTCRLLFNRDRNRDPLRDEMHAEELSAIYRKHDSAEFVPVVFDVIADILAQRGTELPEPGSASPKCRIRPFGLGTSVGF